MDTPHVNTQLSKSGSENLGNYWKYIITGYEYRLYAGVPTGGKVSGDQLRYKTGTGAFPGLTQMTAKVNGQSIASGVLNALYITDNSGLQFATFDSPVIIQDQDHQDTRA